MSIVLLQPLGTFGYVQGTQRVPLQTGVNVHGIRGRLTAQLDVAAGGGVDGTLRTEGVQRLLSSLRVALDGDNIVPPVSGRDLYQLGARCGLEIVAATNLAGAGIQAATQVAFDFYIPFARPYLAQPILTCIPRTLPVNQELAIYYQFDASLAGTGTSTAGTGAFITGGSRDVTLSNVALTFVQEYSTGLVRPWYLPRIGVYQTAQVSAADAQLPLLLTGGFRFDGALLRWLENTDQDAVDGINTLTIQAGGGAIRFYDSVNFTMLQRRELGRFPAASEATQTGTLFEMFADNGLLGTVFDPRVLADPRFVFNVDTPGGGVGQVRALLMELYTRPGVTQKAN